MTDQQTPIANLLDQSRVHARWRSALGNALHQVDTDYLEELLADDRWLPGSHNIFAAFRHAPENCRFLLFGESPYPRAESANGIAFYDAAVDQLWSDKGLSKAINRATSLRNIMKALLLAQNLVTPDEQGKITQNMIAAIDKSTLIQTIQQLFDNLQHSGFLLMNATPVLHPARKPQQESRYWQPFTQQLLTEISRFKTRPTLILWGKIAQQIEQHAVSAEYSKLTCEHPYNLSFIQQAQMQKLFAQLQLLNKT